MHPGSTNSRPDPKAPIERHSLTDGGIAGIYAKSPSIANVGGGSAKDVGTDKAATNFVDLTNKWSAQFKPGDAKGFTPAAEQFATNVLRLNTTSYAPSGRLP